MIAGKPGEAWLVRRNCSSWAVLSKVAPNKQLCAPCKALRSLADWERRLIRLEQLGRAIQAGKA